MKILYVSHVGKWGALKNLHQSIKIINDDNKDSLTVFIADLNLSKNRKKFIYITFQ